jgi:hypothetical protein
MSETSKGHVAVRLDVATLARIDALMPRLSEEWHQATRSDVLRALILTALEDAEKNPEEFASRHRARR